MHRVTSGVDRQVPEPWFCRRVTSPRGEILVEAHNCTRNLQCYFCPPGMAPDANFTGCIDAMAAGTTSVIDLHISCYLLKCANCRNVQIDQEFSYNFD